MIALVLAACLSTPFFPADFSGPVCPPERQRLECECSECLAWDPVPAVDLYEVERETISTGTRVRVGDVLGRWLDPADVSTWSVPTLWCVARDVPFPRSTTVYRYRIRACVVLESDGLCGVVPAVAGQRCCSDSWSSPVEYAGAPYACYEGGREVQCYTGDEVANR